MYSKSYVWGISYYLKHKLVIWTHFVEEFGCNGNMQFWNLTHVLLDRSRRHNQKFPRRRTEDKIFEFKTPIPTIFCPTFAKTGDCQVCHLNEVPVGSSNILNHEWVSGCHSRSASINSTEVDHDGAPPYDCEYVHLPLPVER